jgi:hypothetical protein
MRWPSAALHSLPELFYSTVAVTALFTLVVLTCTADRLSGATDLIKSQLAWEGGQARDQVAGL